ncbi:hypothetical protein [Larkinella humicola]|uniref:DUF4890 domain-containing protein n=1 Tax=Larkinella humicola TaxID=2607654 RepID=A0A5N1JJ47_9BACT|nr:hypothetical protein [Larkinella humicola]KAA9356470.1 hypothetical protein F0P93_01575 [Larkinella humicola]
MKTNLSKALCFVALLLFSVSSFAQRAELGTPEERATRMTARMKEKLNLSAEQETPVAAINLKYAKQNQALLETGGRNLRTARQAQAVMKKKDEELKKVLNSDQYQQYQAIKEEMRAELKERRKQK